MDEVFRSLMADASLSRYTEDVLSAARNSIRIGPQPAQESDFAIGQSKLGGLPDLPPGVEWPTWMPPRPPKKPGLLARLFSKQPPTPEEPLPSPHAFIAQLNLSEIAPYDTAKELPESGMLYFFYDVASSPWGYDPADKGGWRVILWSGDVSQLTRSAAPAGLDQKYIYGTFRPTFSSQRMLPPWESYVLERFGMSRDEIYKYGDVLEELAASSDSPVSRLLGYPDHLQSADMETQCQLAFNGIGTGETHRPDDPRVPDLLKSATDWRLLFQMDCQDLNTNWGDGGRIYYWIQSQDLAQRNMDNVWLVFQCY